MGLCAEEYDRILCEILRESTGEQLLSIPGVYEAVAEELNNDVMARAEQAQERLSMAGRIHTLRIHPGWRCWVLQWAGKDGSVKEHRSKTLVEAERQKALLAKWMKEEEG